MNILRREIYPNGKKYDDSWRKGGRLRRPRMEHNWELTTTDDYRYREYVCTNCGIIKVRGWDSIVYLSKDRKESWLWAFAPRCAEKEENTYIDGDGI